MDVLMLYYNTQKHKNQKNYLLDQIFSYKLTKSSTIKN